MTKNHAKLNAKAVLDVGCRDGFATATLEAELDGVRIVGIDIVPQFVKLAQLVSDEIYEMDAHDLKFKDGEFDYVFSSHTLEHCYDHMKALSEMKRVASKGLYLALPLEPEDSMHDNHSHYFSTVDPLVWANKIDDDKWMVTGVEMSDFCDVIITAMPRTLLDFDKIHTNYKEKTS